MESDEIRREDLPKFLCLYKEFQDCKGNREGKARTSEGRGNSCSAIPDEEVDILTNSDDEEIDILTYSDDEKTDCKSSTSQEYSDTRTLNRSSSSSSLTIHVCTFEGCDKFFSRPYRLEQHIRTHTGERPFECPSESCSRSYTRQQHLKRHIDKCHQETETEEVVECVICEKKFNSVFNLRKHVQAFHERKRYECTECGKSFVKQQHLQSHTYLHTGINPFPCDYPGCEMKFLTPSKLKRHKLIHQKSRYVCPQESCQQKYDTYNDLRCHISAFHPKVCDICSRPFKHLRHLKKHRLTHDSTREAYFCPYEACDKFYYQVQNLSGHIKDKHQQSRIYGCGVCEKKLSTKQKLIHHMATHDSTYKRKYNSNKIRKTRKDKGCIRRDLPSLLSGYNGSGEEENLTHTMQPENSTLEDNNDVSLSEEGS